MGSGEYTKSIADYSDEELYQIYKKGGAAALIWISPVNSPESNSEFWDRRFETRNAEYRQSIAIDKARKAALSGLGMQASDMARLMCNGIALISAKGDSKLLVCRGYIIFPELLLFMEHWWTEVAKTGTIFDPLSDLFYGHMNRERLIIDKNLPNELSEIGVFDCNVMAGPCSRNGEPCEWCRARMTIESRGRYEAYEFHVNVQTNFKRVGGRAPGG